MKQMWGICFIHTVKGLFWGTWSSRCGQGCSEFLQWTGCPSGLSPVHVTHWADLFTVPGPASSRSSVFPPRFLKLVFACVRDKLERVAEDSEAWDSFLRPVIYKLVSKTVATFAAKNLEGSQSLHHLGDAVFSDGFCESRPRRRVGKLGAAGEQRVVALGAHVHPRFEVVLEDFTAKKPTERHDESPAGTPRWFSARILNQASFHRLP